MKCSQGRRETIYNQPINFYRQLTFVNHFATEGIKLCDTMHNSLKIGMSKHTCAVVR